MMPGLVPGIDVFGRTFFDAADDRDKLGHDELRRTW
jgi:hypothetical protein